MLEICTKNIKTYGFLVHISSIMILIEICTKNIKTYGFSLSGPRPVQKMGFNSSNGKAYFM